MITEKMIQARIAEMLIEGGFTVIASEVDEGFKKPAVFVSVYPARIELEFTAMEHVTDAVKITYIPAVETMEHCADTANILRGIFMYKPFEVGDRKLTIQEIDFDIDEYILTASFSLEYYQETPDKAEEEYETMQELGLAFGE